MISHQEQVNEEIPFVQVPVSQNVPIFNEVFSFWTENYDIKLDCTLRYVFLVSFYRIQMNVQHSNQIPFEK